ncbi:hypothetical protein PPL_04338 [Heterostelium album PN500]|uniref:Uncharacterized protein n=1 Tax=Heterostelium pallidum (strain ATCC 26659 / Pp 5 / PN500) TaxID=670386 RepID=D3B7A2_HETP5|nr:hypothetical protein PPL_04338 [Heterostelium album PN500]EFA82645.1 hypothetical protein PPL_04338 [Heterostelium album PN500]|eukprot:XP_020434762.1 hypothetical protein PPL_04338 [Heterostelium album PN500]
MGNIWLLRSVIDLFKFYKIQSSITKLGSSVQTSQTTFKNEIMLNNSNNTLTGQTSNSNQSLVDLNILATVLGILGIKVNATVL